MFIEVCKYSSIGLLIAVFLFSAQAGRAAERDRNASGASGKGKEYSDRDRRAGSEKGKQELERVLKLGQDKEAYRRELEKDGWKITSVNYDKPDYVEWEIVKGDQTYEVQIDLKDNKSTKIDIAPNVWKAKATGEALRKTKTASSARAEK